jgi:hypothetical protein
VRCVAFAKGDRKFLAVTDPFTKLASSIYIYKLDPERPAKRTVAAYTALHVGASCLC